MLRTRQVLRMRYGFGEPACDWEEIEKYVGFSGARVRQIEVQALRRLRIAALGPDEESVQ